MNTGEFTDDYGNKKVITDDDRDALKSVFALSLLSNTGAAPAEVGSIVRNAIKFTKKNATAAQKDDESGSGSDSGSSSEGSSMSKEDLKRYDPDTYNKLYGPGSDTYDPEAAKARKDAAKERRALKDEAMDYVAPAKKSGHTSKSAASHNKPSTHHH
jgi:hypothetical protein